MTDTKKSETSLLEGELNTEIISSKEIEEINDARKKAHLLAEEAEKSSEKVELRFRRFKHKTVLVWKFSPDTPCYVVHKKLSQYAGDNVLILADRKPMVGGTVEKNLVGKKLVMVDKEDAIELFKKLDEKYPQEKKEIKTEEVGELIKQYYSVD